MKLFTKKTLAILLSALIVMGSISILSFAEETGEIDIKTEFYYGTDRSNAPAVVYAQKGDEVWAVVRYNCQGNFYVASSTLLLTYNTDVLEFDPSGHTIDTDGDYVLKTVNSDMGGWFTTDYTKTQLNYDFTNKGVIYAVVTKFKVQKYENYDAFTFKFKVKNDVNLDDVGIFCTDKDFNSKIVNSNIPNPNNFVWAPESQADKTNSDYTVSECLSSKDYNLKINASNNKVVFKGAALFDPNGGKINGSTEAYEANGFYGTNIAETDIPAATAITPPENKVFVGWTYEGADITSGDIAQKEFGGEGAPVEIPVFVAKYEDKAVTVTYTLGDGKTLGAYWSDTNDNADKVVDTHHNGDGLTDEKVAMGNLAKWDNYKFNAWTPGDTTVGTDDITFNATWTGPYYTVKFLDKSGAEIDSDEYLSGNTITDIPAGPANAPHNFVKWVETTDGSEPTTSTAVTRDLVYQPEYTYTLTWKFNNPDGTTGTADKFAELAEGADISVPVLGTDFSWADHNFIRWVDADGKGPADYSNKMPAKDVTFNAQWDEIKYVLTVELDGGAFENANDNPAKNNPYAAGVSVAKPADPKKTGYNFAGWTPEFPIVMDSDKTVTATWTLGEYTITYDANGGEFEGTPTNPVTVPYDTDLSTVAEPEVKKTGMTLKGWNWFDADGNPLASKPATMPGGNLTAKADWGEDTYTITFYDEDGTTPIGTATGKYGDPVTPITAPEKEGKEFDKWDPALPATFSGDTSVKAVYKDKKYTLTVDLDGGQFEDDSMNPAGVDYSYNDSVAKPAADPVKEGYRFTGWSPEFPIVMTSDKTVKALWAGKTTISLDPGEGKKPDGTPYEPFELDSESKDYPDIPDPVNGDKSFAGWYFKDPATGEPKKYDFDKSPSENLGGTFSGSIPLYAVYLTKYNVEYIVDGESVKKAEVLEGSDLLETLPADPVKEGFIFKEWKDAADKTPYDYGKMPSNDLTFTAVFEEKEAGKYTYTFKDRDKTISSGQIAEGDPIPVPPEPSRFGYIFKGWEPEVPTYMPAGDMTFEAQWELDKKFIGLVIGGTVVAGGVVGAVAASNAALITGGAIVGGIVAVAIAANTHKVTYIVDGNTYRVFYILEGTKVIVPKDPTKDGCTFNGWTPEIPDRMPDHDLVFEAKFSGSAAGNNGTPSEAITDVPATGSATAGLAVFAVISSACAAAYVMNKRKHS